MGESGRQRWTAAVRRLLLGAEHCGCTPTGARSGGWNRVRSRLRGDDLTRRHDDHGVHAVPPCATHRRRACSAAARPRADAGEPTGRAARRDRRGGRATPAGALQRIQHVGRAHCIEAAGLHDRYGHRLRPEGSRLVGPRCASLLSVVNEPLCPPRSQFRGASPAPTDVDQSAVSHFAATRSHPRCSRGARARSSPACRSRSS